MIGEGEIVIRRQPREILEFVLDLDRYRQADTKVGRVHWMRRDGDSGQVRYVGKLMGIPGPADTQAFELERWRRLSFRSLPSRWPGALFRFEGEVTCREVEDGTLVGHRESVELRPWVRWLVEPLLSRWLARDTRRELARLKSILEGAPAATA